LRNIHGSARRIEPKLLDRRITMGGGDMGADPVEGRKLLLEYG